MVGALIPLRRIRLPAQAGVDAAAWALGLWFANAVRYDFQGGEYSARPMVTAAALAAVLQLGFGAALHLYRGRYRFGSFDEVRGVLRAAGATTVTLAAANFLWPGALLVPRSVPFAGGVLAFTGMVGVRYSWRMFLERRLRPTPQGAEPLLIFGAGEGGDQMLAAMLRDPQSRWFPVGLLDDDPRKRKLRLRGVPVLGGREQLGAAAERSGATTVLVAIPTAGAPLVRELSDRAEEVGLAVKVLPPVSEVIDGRIGVEDIRDLDLTDLLGRRQIELDVDSIAGYLTGKRVLVTGAGGSIGSELCAQIARFGPAELIMLDRDESALHAVQLAISGRALLDGDELVLADIRDIDHMHRIFLSRRPEVVFHAAALKHLTLLERFPGESVKSNVWGTLTVLEAAKAAGVGHFVNISTDKAADPTSVLGYSKRIAERLTAYVAREASGTYLSVRFGNVLGSRGSVLTTFAAQVEGGGPLTVTDPKVTRYFMTVQEAVQLVIQAAAVGRDGEVLVLDMGQPVSIDDIARRLAADAPRPMEIVYTGLRPGEKLHEDLLGAGEVDERPCHALLSQAHVPPLHPSLALGLDPWAAAGEVLVALRSTSATTSEYTEFDGKTRLGDPRD